MLNKGDFSQKREGLKAVDIGKATAAILTVLKVETVQLKDNVTQEPRNALAVTFAEFKDKAYWPNNTSIGYLIDQLGTDEAKWVNKKVPLEKVKANNPTSGRVQDSLWVAAPKDWSTYLKSGGTVAKTAKSGR